MLRSVFAAILLLSSLLGAHATSRVALLVGVSNYEHAPHLANTLNDAKDMASVLRRLGFEVELLLDPDRPAFEAAVRRYGSRSIGADVTFFYYSGHALESSSHNWLLPVAASLNTERDLRYEAVDLGSIQEQTDGAAKVSLIFLDACRDNPFAQRLSATRRDTPPRGLAQVSIATGVLVAFSTSPGQFAFDGPTTRRNSPFTAALLRHMETPGLEIKALLARVTKDVVETTNGIQRPWQNSSLVGDFYFVPPSVVAAEPSTQTLANLEGVFWDSIRTSRDPADFRAYLTRFPRGVFVELAYNRLALLQQDIASKAEAGALPSAPSPESRQSPAPSPAPTGVSPSSSTEVAVMIERAHALIGVGDINSARLVLRRAYDNGSAQAAIELGRTYDPLVLKELNISAFDHYADAARARDWYGKAADLGYAGAAQHIRDVTLINR